MNRAERRAQKYKRAQPTHKELSLYQLHLLNHCRPYEPGDTTSEHFKTWDAYTRLKDGSASEDDFLRVGKPPDFRCVKLHATKEYGHRLLRGGCIDRLNRRPLQSFIDAKNLPPSKRHSSQFSQTAPQPLPIGREC